MNLLAVTPDDKDWASLQAVFAHSNWVLHREQSATAAIPFCRAHDPAVVLCGCDAGNGGWRSLLTQLKRDGVKAPVVVFTHEEQDCLWSEILAAGGYDLLVVPFDKHEVLRVVTQAWLQWHRRHRRDDARAVS